MATCCHLGKGGRTIAFQAMRLDYRKPVRDEISRIIEARAAVSPLPACWTRPGT
jgi:hypothetical protein